MVNSNHFVGLSYRPDDVRFGHDSSYQYFFERRRNQAILQGSLRLFDLQTQYARSQSESPVYTLLVHRDNLISLALALSLRCLQTRDILYVEMTTHAQRFWEKNSNNFWSELPAFEDNPNYTPEDGFTGVAGSLAFLLYANQDMGQGLYPIELIEKMLSYLWPACGTQTNRTPQQKQADLIQCLGARFIPFAQYQAALTNLYNSDLNALTTNVRSLLVRIRQRLITLTDWELLKLRWVLGEINNELIDSIVELQTLVNQDTDLSRNLQLNPLNPTTLTTFTQQVNQILPPAGAPLFYVGLTVEALINVARSITQTPELHATPYSEFLVSSSHTNLRSQWSLQFATAYDAMAVLAQLSTLYEARGLSYRFFLLALQLIEGLGSIPATGPYRLQEITR